VQIAEQEILGVVTSLVHCCTIKNVIVPSQMQCCRCTVHSSRGVKLAASGPNPACHDPFSGPCHVSFVLALGLTELRLLLCHRPELRFMFIVITRHYDLIITLNQW